jgi:uncharacterized membrane protein
VITLTHVWIVVGLFVAGVAIANARDRRWRIAAFWAIVAVALLAGDAILDAAKAGTHWPAQLMGGGVVALALLAARSRSRVPDDEAREPTHGNVLFAPALAIPAVTLAIFGASKLWPGVASVIDPASTTLIALAIACLVALAFALVVTRSRPRHALVEGRRLLDAFGWAAVLPMMLATLGGVFAATGVGDAVAHVVSAVIPTDRPYACLAAFGLGMVVFTVIMGNAFAAFPVMMGGIGLPLLVDRHGADPAALGAIGMLTGYCGTLLTPMAANFNIVPVVLLELRDDHAVIRAQWPTAVVLLVVNLAIMAFTVF